MLTSVPQNVAKMARTVVINHPNAFNCQVIRKVVNQAPGQMIELDSEDEENISWDFIGNGYAVQVVDTFQPANMNGWQDANNTTDEQRFLIEPESAPGDPTWFEVHKHDVVYILLASGLVKLAFEVVQVETPLNIPPFCMRYVMNRRDDLHLP